MTISNRDIDRLWQKYNPNNISAGDIVEVSVGTKYRARVVGLDLDLKNRKVYANLKLLEQAYNVPIRVDACDCKRKVPL